jgi:hypothetical protein
MINVALMAVDPETGAKKVGTYDIPEDRMQGTPPPPEPRRGLSWLWWILGLLVLLALAAWAFQSCMPGTAPGTTAPTGAVTTVPGDAAVEPAGGVVAGDNAAVCTAVADYNTLAGQAPAIGADTPVADVSAYYNQVQTAGTAVTSAAAAVPGLDLTAFNSAMSTLGGAIAGLTGDVVGDAAEGLTAAFAGVNDAFNGVGTAAGC